MTIEEKIKDLILQKYGSLLEFTKVVDMSYSTVKSILNRGIGNANVTNIIRICRELNISVDALTEGNIVPIPKSTNSVENVIAEMKSKLKEMDSLTLGGKPIDNTELQSILDQIDLVVALAEKKK